MSSMQKENVRPVNWQNKMDSIRGLNESIWNELSILRERLAYVTNSEPDGGEKESKPKPVQSDFENDLDKIIEENERNLRALQSIIRSVIL